MISNGSMALTADRSCQTGTQMSARCTHMPPPTIKDWTLLQPAVNGRLTVPSVRTTLLPRRPQRSNRVIDGRENSWKNPDGGSRQLEITNGDGT